MMLSRGWSVASRVVGLMRTCILSERASISSDVCEHDGARTCCDRIEEKQRRSVATLAVEPIVAFESRLISFGLLNTNHQPIARPISSGRTKGLGDRPPPPLGQSSDSDSRGGGGDETG